MTSSKNNIYLSSLLSQLVMGCHCDTSLQEKKACMVDVDFGVNVRPDVVLAPFILKGIQFGAVKLIL